MERRHKIRMQAIICCFIILAIEFVLVYYLSINHHIIN